MLKSSKILLCSERVKVQKTHELTHSHTHYIQHPGLHVPLNSDTNLLHLVSIDAKFWKPVTLCSNSVNKGWMGRNP